MKRLMIAAAVLALTATASYAEKAVSLPVAMLVSWCPIDVTRMDVWERSTEQVVETAPECMMVTATGYRGAEDGCKFIHIWREGDGYAVRMQCDAAGDCEFTGHRLKQCIRNRPVSTSIFRLDGDRLSIREKK